MGVLMQIQAAGEVFIKRILDLGDFDEVYKGAMFEVWVAPTRAHLQEWAAITEFIQNVSRNRDQFTEEEIEAAVAEWESRRLAWFAETWRNISLEEAREIQEALPELAWDWLIMRTSKMIGDFKTEKVGNSGGG